MIKFLKNEKIIQNDVKEFRDHEKYNKKIDKVSETAITL